MEPREFCGVPLFRGLGNAAESSSVFGLLAQVQEAKL